MTAQILVLNKQWAPVGIADLERAMGLLCTGAAKALDKEHQMYDFASWSELRAEYGDATVSTPNRVIKIPTILVLQVYDRLPHMRVRFSRNAVYLRDNFTCQYCAKKFPRQSLNLDHVEPRSRGGRTSWTNIVCACYPCNTKKGDKTPAEAGMPLLKKPAKPRVSGLNLGRATPAEWLPFIDPVSAAYWNSELEE